MVAKVVQELGRRKSTERRSRLSLNNLVGAGEDRGRHDEAERLRGLEIDHQLEIGRLLDRQIGRLGAVEDLSDATISLSVLACMIRSCTPFARAPSCTSSIMTSVYRKVGLTNTAIMPACGTSSGGSSRQSRGSRRI